jgi:hypothetical protein
MLGVKGPRNLGRLGPYLERDKIKVECWVWARYDECKGEQGRENTRLSIKIAV